MLSSRPENYNDRPTEPVNRGVLGEPKPILPVMRSTIEAVRGKLKAHRPGGRNITVFSSAGYPFGTNYTHDAIELGALIGERGHNLVWGGTESGMMHRLANAARSAGASLVGVAYCRGEAFGRHTADYMFDAPTLPVRKQALIALGDAAISLPGGLGTFDEVATYLERRKAGARKPPLILLNSEGYYDGLRLQIDRMKEEGFMSPGNEVHFAETPLEAVQLAETVQPPKAR